MGAVQTAAEESGVLGLAIQVTDGDTKGPVCPQILQGPLVSCMLETKALKVERGTKEHAALAECSYPGGLLMHGPGLGTGGCPSDALRPHLQSLGLQGGAAQTGSRCLARLEFHLLPGLQLCNT